MWRSLTASAVLLVLAAGDDVRFGRLKIEEKSVVFVVDGSRWMKNKFVELRDELGYAVERMPADGQFGVMFFADEKVKGFADGQLVPASDDNKGKLKDWLNDVELGHDPTPEPALTRAFEAKPQAVVLVTDGKFDDYDGVEAHVDSLNADRKVHVHTAGFFSTETEDDSRSFARFMNRVAERNNGKFVVVYADELKRRAR